MRFSTNCRQGVRFRFTAHLVEWCSRTNETPCARVFWRGTTNEEDAQGTPTKSHTSPSALVCEEKNSNEKVPHGERGFRLNSWSYSDTQNKIYLIRGDEAFLHAAQGYLGRKKTHTPIGPPGDPRHRPTVGSSRGVFSCK